jgi:hypothetical protein
LQRLDSFIRYRNNMWGISWQHKQMQSTLLSEWKIKYYSH